MSHCKPSPLEKDAIGSVVGRFSRAAATYDVLADIQKAVAARLIESIRAFPAPRTILEVGCGSGQLTKFLLETWPDASIDAIDASSAMVSETGRALGRPRRLALFTAEAMTFSGRGAYDMVISSSSLHWMCPLPGVIRHLAGLVIPGGCFAHAVMLAGTLGELRAARLRVAPQKVPRREVPVAGEVLRSVADAGLVVKMNHEEETIVTYANATAFLRSLHDQGVTGGDISHAGGLLTRGELARLVADYEARYRTDFGRIYATFRVLYLAATRASVAGTAG